MLLKKENDDLTEKYMRIAMSHDVTCLIQEHMQKKETTISGLKERIADLEQKVTRMGKYVADILGFTVFYFFPWFLLNHLITNGLLFTIFHEAM